MPVPSSRQSRCSAAGASIKEGMEIGKTPLSPPSGWRQGDLPRIALSPHVGVGLPLEYRAHQQASSGVLLEEDEPSPLCRPANARDANRARSARDML